MKEINKLVGLVTKKLSSNFGVIDLSGAIDNPGKEQQLYNGVLMGDFFDDEVTAKGMYQSNVYDQRFRMLKSRLRYKLYDLLYHLDFETPHFSFTSQKLLECKANLHRAQILIELGEFEMAEKLFNKVIVLASDCQFTRELIEAFEMKRTVLCKEHKPTDFELSLKELATLRGTQQKEAEAEDQFLRIELLLTKSVHSRNISGRATTEAIKQLESSYGKTNSYNIFENLHQLKVWFYMLEGDYEDLDQYLKQAYASLTKHKGAADRFDHATHFHLLAKNHLILNQFDKGRKAILKALEYSDKSTDQWFYHQEIRMLIEMHSKKYGQALDVMTEVLKNPNFNRASDQIINRWKIFKLYLNFAFPEKGIQKRVRFYDIYEASESYFKELKGYRISLYLLEFIHNLNKDTTDQAISKLDDLEAYFYKNLNDPGKNQREKQFIKMLKVLRSNEFDTADTQVAIQPYFKKMGEKKVLSHFSDFEIIPYEDFWQMIVKVVKKNMITVG